MSEKVVIRDYRPEDLEAVYEIEKSSFPDAWPKSQLRLYRPPQAQFLVATLGGEVIGYVIGKVERSLEDRLFFGSGKVGHILNIAVSPELRRSGVGTRMMKALEDLFRIEGADRIKLEVRASNLSAQRFYEGLGYRMKKKSLLYYGDEDGIIMEKDLS
jgi:ribosomal-protein-alanine N-acetyltransferase